MFNAVAKLALIVMEMKERHANKSGGRQCFCNELTFSKCQAISPLKTCSSGTLTRD